MAIRKRPAGKLTSAVIADPKEARLLAVNRRFRAVSRRSMRARKLRRFYRSIKLPALVAALCGIALGLVQAVY